MQAIEDSFDVSDGHHGRASQEGQLYVAHHGRGAVDVLRHEQHMLLVVDAVLPRHVRKGDEHGPCAAGRIAHADIAPSVRLPRLPAITRISSYFAESIINDLKCLHFNIFNI